MAVFIKTPGEQNYIGTETEYDQVDYPGSVSEYTITQNQDGTITVSHPELGTDTLSSIEGFWFIGDSSWYSIDDAIALAGGGELPPDPTITGSDADDSLIGTNIDNVFLGSTGDDTIDGNGGGYNQVNYEGALADYTLRQNEDGSVTVFHPDLGTDNLTDIDGFWFSGEAVWYGLADALQLAGGEIPTTENPTTETPTTETPTTETPTTPEEPVTETPTDGDGGGGNGRGGGRGNRPDRNNNDPVVEEPVVNEPVDTGGQLSGGTMNGGIYTGSNENDTLSGSDNGDTFYVGMGTDTVDGNGGTDILRLDGDVIEWIFTENANGSVTISHATWGENTITDVEMLTFMRSGTTMSVAEAIAATDGLPTYRMDADGVLNGTVGDDVMVGTRQTDNFYGGVGDDSYDGRGGFDQINYDGNRSEYDISLNSDGTLTVSHEVWGTDTVTNVEGLYFNGNNEWIAVTDLV